MTARVAILISGGGSNMVALLDAMAQADFGAIPAVVLTNDPTAGGLKKAAERGVPTEVVDHRDYLNRADFEVEIVRRLKKYDPDVVCLAGFMRILGTAFVGNWQGRMLNIHPSLLPKYKGLHTHARALAAGDAAAGCSVHMVTAALDDGPILGQTRVPIVAGDTVGDLAARVLVEEHKLYPKVLREFVRAL
jgi:phosphoribosylglycinamide formyltransferase-1